MSIWEHYPAHYRSQEVEFIYQAVCSGECVSVIGLSGSGKSNLMGFIAHRLAFQKNCPRFILLDCNRLEDNTPTAFFRLARRTLVANGRREHIDGETDDGGRSELARLDDLFTHQIAGGHGVCLLLDRFDALYSWSDFNALASNLRALRDSYKYHLTYVVAARRPVNTQTELAELFFGHVLWLGPLTKEDAFWSAKRDAERFSAGRKSTWDQDVLEKLIDHSWGYPAFLRASCEAYASGAALTQDALRTHPAVERRLTEFWADQPDEEMIQLSGLAGHPFLVGGPSHLEENISFDTTGLTAKENALLEYLIDHDGKVCEKDELVQAVWPEDVIFARGVRDDSLAQLIRRLRVKIEVDPGKPRFIITVPGRGYIFRME